MILTSFPTELIYVIIVVTIILVSLLGILVLANKVRGMVFNKEMEIEL